MVTKCHMGKEGTKQYQQMTHRGFGFWNWTKMITYKWLVLMVIGTEVLFRETWWLLTIFQNWTNFRAMPSAISRPPELSSLTWRKPSTNSKPGRRFSKIRSSSWGKTPLFFRSHVSWLDILEFGISFTLHTYKELKNVRRFITKPSCSCCEASD